MTIARYSSRGGVRLDRVYLAERLRGATAYRRIAGYFRSSIFELVGEEIAAIPSVQIVCNSELDPADFRVAVAAAQQRRRPAALLDQWNDVAVGLDALLDRDRYRRLFELLSGANLEIRIVPRDRMFVHGKAGVIVSPDGATSFLGSVNETRSAFAANYEILWEDRSPEGVTWVDAEFDALWKVGVKLPEAVIDEVKRRGDRMEISLREAKDNLAPAVFAETPLYRGGEQLEPWQRAFVARFLEHRRRYGKARLLLADEVGLGKTLSMAASAVMSVLLEEHDQSDGPVLVLCPSTVQNQWQTELWDRLGVPSAVWNSTDKVWIDHGGHVISAPGAPQVMRCPCQVAIVSTGLVFRAASQERALLLKGRYGTVILDEAHKARMRAGLGNEDGEPNNLLSFMRAIAARTRNLLLGTATPIQTRASELWDLLGILGQDAPFVLGTELSPWAHFESIEALVKNQAAAPDEKAAWELLRDPLPTADEDDAGVFHRIRQGADVDDNAFLCDTPFVELPHDARLAVEFALEPAFFHHHNPAIRHTVLRKRAVLEDMGLLTKIGVDVHPDPRAAPGAYGQVPFVGQALITNPPFQAAYAAAREFAALLGQRPSNRGRGAGAAALIEASLLQRICSSFESGRATAQKLLDRGRLDDEDGESERDDDASDESVLRELTPAERSQLEIIVAELARDGLRDPKLATIVHFLDQHHVGVGAQRHTWREHGCIIFSQYYDTARWVADALASLFPSEPVAIYAGAGRSVVRRDGRFVAAAREDIKRDVKDRRLRLLVATDAACEGLNLQTLGTLINVDLPWNPSRLEQRLGRIKRIGQTRTSVDMLNLVYAGTRDEVVYRALSARMKNTYDLFGSLPDTIDDAWIEDEAKLGMRLDQYVSERDAARNAFDVRYRADVNVDDNRWEQCSRVLARRDVIDRLSKPWR